MRPSVAIALALFCTAIGAATALAGDPHVLPTPRPQMGAPLPPIRLPLNMATMPHRPAPDATPRLRLGGEDRMSGQDALAGSAVSIGPLKARLGGTAKRAHIARYRLEDMDVLGGSVSGTLDGRGARVYLRWPPDDDE